MNIDLARKRLRYPRANTDELPLRLAYLKESAAYRQFWKRRGHLVLEYFEARRSGRKVNPLSFWGALEGFGIHFLQLHVLNTPDVEHILNPYHDGELSPAALAELPRVLSAPAVKQIVKPGDPLECAEGIFRSNPELEPNERLLLVDLAQPRQQLMQEFKRFLAKASKNQNRHRTEAWQHLKVWRLRRQRKPFIEIARQTGLTVPAAKLAFARAFELIEGRRYDPVYYAQQYKTIESLELKKTCADCAERNTCVDLCPDVLSYIDQDQVTWHEPLLDDFLNTPAE